MDGIRGKQTEFSDPALLPQKPRVSVVMLAYNHSRCLGQAIEGVLLQETDFPIELLIGDDRSKDNTLEIALEYQRKYPRMIRVITSDTNVGAQPNAARLIEASRGDLIALCEGDDYWIAKDKLQRQVALFDERPDVSICFHTALVLNDESQQIVGSISTMHAPRDFSLSASILGSGGMMPTPSIVIRRSALCPLDDWLLTCPVGDYPIAIWAASRGVCHGMPEAMCVYRRSETGSWTASDKQIQSNWRNAKGVIAMLEAFPEKAGRADAAPACARMARKMLRTLAIEFGAGAATALPGWTDYATRLTPIDRLVVAACYVPFFRRVLVFGLAKARPILFRLRH